MTGTHEKATMTEAEAEEATKPRKAQTARKLRE